MKLIPLYDLITRFYPEVALPELETYCTEADMSEDERREVVQSLSRPVVHTGYNSLKWGLMAVNDIDKEAVKHVLRDIIFEHIARGLPFEKIEYNILSFAAIKPWKPQIRDNQPVDITQFPIIPVGQYKIMLNVSDRILTGPIFKKTRVDGILFRNANLLSAGFVFRPGPYCELNQLVGFKNYLYDQLSALEDGWKKVFDDKNDIKMIANYGTKEGTPTTLEAKDILNIIEKYFN